MYTECLTAPHAAFPPVLTVQGEFDLVFTAWDTSLNSEDEALEG